MRMAATLDQIKEDMKTDNASLQNPVSAVRKMAKRSIFDPRISLPLSLLQQTLDEGQPRSSSVPIDAEPKSTQIPEKPRQPTRKSTTASRTVTSTGVSGQAPSIVVQKLRPGPDISISYSKDRISARGGPQNLGSWLKTCQGLLFEGRRAHSLKCRVKSLGERHMSMINLHPVLSPGSPVRLFHWILSY
ncbi:hypothetical protein BDW71DRAFT_82693 [Aspergillus fruticulosus]